VTLDPVAANEARDLDDAAAILSTGGAVEGSLVVLDRYEVEPLTISPGQPFNLTLTLHNIGKVGARQMTITWGDEAIAPLGVGRVRYAGDIAAGEAVLQGQFVLTDPASTGSHTLPLSLAFTDGDGRTVERTENIVLLVDAARDQTLQPAPSSVQANPTMPPAASPTALSPAVETEAAPSRPLWLRLIRALLGLGD
jgi:hypothetical protein